MDSLMSSNSWAHTILLMFMLLTELPVCLHRLLV